MTLILAALDVADVIRRVEPPFQRRCDFAGPAPCDHFTERHRRIARGADTPFDATAVAADVDNAGMRRHILRVSGGGGGQQVTSGQRVNAAFNAGGVDSLHHGVFIDVHSGSASCRACSAALAMRARAMSA